jgi:ABC-type lipoprotein export system ATPase subunit
MAGLFLWFKNQSSHMTISLHEVVPVPLKEKLLQQASGIWNRDLVFTTPEWIKIKAPSGTGKTTFIHSLYRLRTDFTGEIKWDDRNISTLTAEELAVFRQQKISIVFQDLRLFPHLTAWENIELNRILQTAYCEKERITEMAQILGIDHILQQPAALCSYGEQQRVAIIRALVQPFEWLIMDEPFSHLDKVNAGKAAALITAACKERDAGIIITDLHDDDHFDYSRKLVL